MEYTTEYVTTTTNNNQSVDPTTPMAWLTANFTDGLTDPSSSSSSSSSSNQDVATFDERNPISWDDATWIMTCSFIIFTMQSGFGLLEAGCVSSKNEVNIMVKNAADVIFGGLTYWLFGYGLSFGDGPYANPFVGIGKFLLDSDDPDQMGQVFSTYIFQLSFATTATTIVSGAMAERTRLDAYMIFSMLNTVIYCVPAHWLWAPIGFLSKLGAIDIAGSAGVHLVGGTAGLVATLMLRPRKGRFDKDSNFDAMPGNPTNCVVGMFMLWWGWLGFNCGSTFGISGGKWKLAAKSAVVTLNGSIGGGCMGLLYSYIVKKRKYDVSDMVNGVLGSLVSITAGCAVLRPWEAMVVGLVGGLLVVDSCPLITWLKIDDPVGAISVHGVGGLWGMLAVGLFVSDDPIENLTDGHKGAFRGGGFYLLGVQTLSCVCIVAWSAVCTFLLLFVINKAIGLRMSEFEEEMGADFVEHGIGVTTAIQVTADKTIEATNRASSGSGTQSNYMMRRTSYGFTRRTSPYDATVNPSVDGTVGADPNRETNGMPAPLGNGHVNMASSDVTDLTDITVT